MATVTTKDIATLLAELHEKEFPRVMNGNPLAQFGEPNLPPLLGPTLLPERTVDENSYYETAIRYRTEIANDGTAYSPVQMKGSALVGSMKVDLVGHADVGSDFTSNEYDQLSKMLASGRDFEAMATLVQWVNSQLLMPLVHKNEKYIWDAIVDAQIVRVGDNGFTETVAYSNPPNHRRTLTSSGTTANPAGWYETDVTDTYDPWEDIYERINLLTEKGYSVSRIITSRSRFQVLARHHFTHARLGPVIKFGSNELIGPGQVTLAAVNGILAQDGLPPIELFDRRYNTATGSFRFMPEDAMVFIGNTANTYQIDLGDDSNLIAQNGGSRFLSISNAIGYLAVGRTAGSPTPGRVIHTELRERKPKAIYGEAYQTTIPVITEPEAIAVLRIPAPTAA